MKNIHLISTDKPSRLWINNLLQGKLELHKEVLIGNNTAQNIYITSNNHNDISDEGINHVAGSWVLDTTRNKVYKTSVNIISGDDIQKIILTDNADLIKDSVQAIPDEFLQWFVKNPSCEEVDVMTDAFTVKEMSMLPLGTRNLKYKIIIPQEKPKQLFTDYPITELGDEEFKESPIRECELLSYDDNKYCYVKVEGIEKEIKRCYIYPQKGRCGEIDCVSIDEIKELLKEEPKQETVEESMEKNGYHDKPSDDLWREGVEFGAKFQAKKMGLMEIELNHTKTLLASCEKALEERDLQAKQMYSEEDIYSLLDFIRNNAVETNEGWQMNKIVYTNEELFEKFKKK
jgi:hypothetical protein